MERAYPFLPETVENGISVYIVPRRGTSSLPETQDAGCALARFCSSENTAPGLTVKTVSIVDLRC